LKKIYTKTSRSSSRPNRPLIELFEAQISYKSGKKERVDLGAHMMSHNLFYWGRQKPHYMEEKSLRGVLAGTKPEDKEACSDFLDRYEIKVMSHSNIFYCYFFLF
jgi:hypothetical protein